MANTKLTEKTMIHQMEDSHSIFMNAGGKVAQISVADFRTHLNDNDNQVLNDLAFFMDINEGVSSGTEAQFRVNTGGNMNMRQLWEDSIQSILLDENGNYCLLNDNDARYTEDGEYVMSGDKLSTNYEHLDMMGLVPQTYIRIQLVPAGGRQIKRVWLSLVPLPGGMMIPQLVVGKFKGFVDAQGRYRSIPGVVPTASRKIDDFWACAQKRSKNHGLAGLDFRDFLLYHMMSKYSWRNSQTCRILDGSPIWGVGLDGSESAGNGDQQFAAQKGIITGKTLSLGLKDGNVQVLDAQSASCHSVNVKGFENVWGQYWEMIQGLCSVGSDVYFWRSNFVPSTATPPTATTFKNIDHIKLLRSTVEGATEMNILTGDKDQGAFMIPMATNSRISYGDYFYYNANGQLWLFGGCSASGASCGLGSSSSSYVWSSSYSTCAARLAYYGGLNKVSSSQLRR